jgi:antitoxin component YwqK of YwqJK toxin-antitoxin module
MITGYTYDEDIIYTINVYDDDLFSYYESKEENSLYTEYLAINFKIIKVENIDGNICDGYVSNETVEKEQMFYFLTKEIPINIINYNIFFHDNNKLKKEFSGIQKRWYGGGQLYEEFFHINGKKYDKYKSYHLDGSIHVECTYIDDKENGEFKEYDEKGNLKKNTYYVNGKEVN